MGSPCELRLYAESEARAESVADAARAELARLETRYSRYREDSITSAINRSAGDPAGVVVDDETASLLDYVETCFAQSDGLFDVTSGVLRRAWDFRAQRVPSQAEIDAVRERVGWRRVRWERPRLALPTAGMEIDLGGIVKEYAADRVVALCRRLGLRHGLIDLGGDLCVVGPHPDGSPWRVGVRDPRGGEEAVARVALAAGGIASSGDYERGMTVGGRRYGHLLDPRSGWPVQGLSGVSVVASHCVVAGSAATIAMLKGAGEGPAWLDALGLPHVHVGADGEIAGTLAPGARASAPRAAQDARLSGRAA